MYVQPSPKQQKKKKKKESYNINLIRGRKNPSLNFILYDYMTYYFSFYTYFYNILGFAHHFRVIK